MEWSNEMELLFATSVTGIANIAYTTLCHRNKVLEFLFWVVPQYLVIIYPEEIPHIYSTLFCIIDYSRLKRPKSSCTNPNATLLRSSMMLMVVIAIYACDFRIFPKKFGKTYDYGLSFMDIGVGAFLYNAGFFSFRARPRKLLISGIVLLILGFTRLYVINLFKLHVNLYEYGKHFNFYFILGTVQLIFLVFRSRHNFALGLFISATHEVFLIHAKDVILSPDRYSFVTNNKEGLISIMPCFAIFLLSNKVGEIAFSKYRNRQKFFLVGTLTILYFLVFKAAQYYHAPSRRLVNLAYIMWILFLHTLEALLLTLLSSYVEILDMDLQIYCSRNMLLIFVWANLLVLAGNLCFNLKEMSALMAHMHNILYLSAVFMIPAIILRKPSRT